MSQHWRVYGAVVLLWSLAGFTYTDTVPAGAAEPKPLQQWAETLEGNNTPSALALFSRYPLGFDLQTFQKLLTPVRAPADFLAALATIATEKRQQLSGQGLLFLSGFALVTLIGLLARQRVKTRRRAYEAALKAHTPPWSHPLITATFRVAAAALTPLSLLLLFLLLQACLDQEEALFRFIAHLLALWTGVAGFIAVAREVFLGPLAPVPHGAALFRVTRLFVFYVVYGLVVLWGGEVLSLPSDVLALIRFLLVLTAAVSVFLLWTLKDAVLAFFPLLPNRMYQRFLMVLDHAYQPILFLMFMSGLLWGAGYHNLVGFLWRRSWAVVMVFLVAVFLHHLSLQWVRHRILSGPASSEAALAFSRALIVAITSVITIAATLLTLSLMRLLPWSLSLFSTPFLTIGTTSVSWLLLLEAVLIFVAFFLFSRLLRTYLDYQVYPAFTLDPGVATAINTFLTYTLGTLGVLIGLHTIGLDLHTLTIFAGALGIGAGFGLQSITSNLAAGLTLVFGRVLRRGDVVMIGDNLGTIQEVGMRVTHLRTLDNIELLVPNAHLVDTPLTNYTHTSPLIRLHVPVGVSYGSDPDHVQEIMLKVAQACPQIEASPASEVWFVEFGESALNFELLVWMNIRRTSRGQVTSALYFGLFRAFKAAGIEIPFPQRDLHLRTSIPWEEPVPPPGKTKGMDATSCLRDDSATQTD